MSPKKWQLLSAKDISPSKWFPLEMRTYQLPNGKIVDDFSVATLSDVAMIIPITKSGQVVVVKQFKPGFGDVIIEFPAGRIELDHKNIKQTALHELAEETGIVTQDIEYFATLAGFVTKATEKVSCFIAKNVEFNAQQHLDATEEIEVLTLSPQELDRLIETNELQAAITIAAWAIAKKKFPDLFGIV